MRPAPSQITHLLRRWGEGDSQAFDQLIPLVYDRMRQHLFVDHARARKAAKRGAGATPAEFEEALDISLATVKRELRSARAWLATELQSEPA